MGAQEFAVLAEGETAQKAFEAAIDRAFYDYGHRGYTGTIAEKHDFVEFGKMTEAEADLTSKTMLMDRDPCIDDKWGPAGCIELTDKPGTYLFFGIASC